MRRKPPKIFYATRTHSQIAQVCGVWGVGACSGLLVECGMPNNRNALADLLRTGHACSLTLHVRFRRRS